MFLLKVLPGQPCQGPAITHSCPARQVRGSWSIARHFIWFYSASSFLFGGSYSIWVSGGNSQRPGEDRERVKSAMSRSHWLFSFTTSDFSRPSDATDQISSSDTYLTVPWEKLLVEPEQVRISKWAAKWVTCWPRGAEGLGTSPPARWSRDLHKRGVGTSSCGFCCDMVGVRHGDLSRLERNQKPSTWHGCGQQTRSWDAMTCQRCRCNGQPYLGRRQGCQAGLTWEDEQFFSLVTVRGGSPREILERENSF